MFTQAINCSSDAPKHRHIHLNDTDISPQSLDAVDLFSLHDNATVSLNSMQ